MIEALNNKLDAIMFLRATLAAFRYTNIEHAVSDDEDISKCICNLDNIVRSSYITSNEKELFKNALLISDYNPTHESLKTDLEFIFFLINEIIFIIDKLQTDEAGRKQLNDINKGLKELRDSISFGDPCLPENSGMGITLVIFDILSYRKSYHAIYRGFTNSTPLAKYFIVINTLTRRTSCQVRIP